MPIDRQPPPLPATRDRPVWPALIHGAQRVCPSCAKAPLFKSYLKVIDRCTNCSEAFFHQRADDAPPYFTMLIVGHVVVGGMLAVEQAFSPPTWLQLALWLPLTVVLSLYLLPVVKGSLVALQWALRMHGFGSMRDPAGASSEAPTPATPRSAGGSLS